VLIGLPLVDSVSQDTDSSLYSLRSFTKYQITIGITTTRASAKALESNCADELDRLFMPRRGAMIPATPRCVADVMTRNTIDPGDPNLGRGSEAACMNDDSFTSKTLVCYKN
jgi:hypothetical protein